MTKRVKFKKRYVLGEGHPEPAFGEHHVHLMKAPRSNYSVELNFTSELRRRDIPKYRLVLEKIKL